MTVLSRVQYNFSKNEYSVKIANNQVTFVPYKRRGGGLDECDQTIQQIFFGIIEACQGDEIAQNSQIVEGLSTITTKLAIYYDTHLGLPSPKLDTATLFLSNILETKRKFNNIKYLIGKVSIEDTLDIKSLLGLGEALLQFPQFFKNESTFFRNALQKFLKVAKELTTHEDVSEEHLELIEKILTCTLRLDSDFSWFIELLRVQPLSEPLAGAVLKVFRTAMENGDGFPESSIQQIQRILQVVDYCMGKVATKNSVISVAAAFRISMMFSLDARSELVDLPFLAHYSNALTQVPQGLYEEDRWFQDSHRYFFINLQKRFLDYEVQPFEIRHFTRCMHAMSILDPTFSWLRSLVMAPHVRVEHLELVVGCFRELAAGGEHFPSVHMERIKSILGPLEDLFRAVQGKALKDRGGNLLTIKDLLFLSFIAAGIELCLGTAEVKSFARALTMIGADSEHLILASLSGRFWAVLERFRAQKSEVNEYFEKIDVLNDCIRCALKIDPQNLYFPAIIEEILFTKLNPDYFLFGEWAVSLSAATPAEESFQKRIAVYPEQMKKRLFCSEQALEKVSTVVLEPLTNGAVDALKKWFAEFREESVEPLQGELARLEYAFAIFNSFQSLPLELFEKEVKDVKLLQLALFCEDRFRGSSTSLPQYLKRSETGLEYTFIFYPGSKELMIGAEKRVSVLHAHGSYKNTRSALNLSLETVVSAEVVARLFTKRGISSHSYNEVKREIAVYKQFSGKPGIVKLRKAMEFFPPGSPPRIEMIFDRYDGEFGVVGRGLDDIEKLQVARDYITGLYTLHQAGYLHGDIKPGNLFCSKKDLLTKLPKGCIGDLGYAAKVENGKKAPDDIFDLYKHGYYGTPRYTAPELFQVRYLIAEDYFKLDVWALGLSLYELHHGAAPWKKLMDEAFELFQITEKACLARKIPFTNDTEVVKRDQAEFSSSVREFIEDNDHYKQLAIRKNRGEMLAPNEELDVLIYSMLRLNPADRIFSTIQL